MKIKAYELARNQLVSTIKKRSTHPLAGLLADLQLGQFRPDCGRSFYGNLTGLATEEPLSLGGARHGRTTEKL